MNFRMDVDSFGKDNHSGLGRGDDHSEEPKRLRLGKPYESLKWWWLGSTLRKIEYHRMNMTLSYECNS